MPDDAALKPDDPAHLWGKVERLRDILAQRAVGAPGYGDEEQYRQLRAELRANPEVGPLLPSWVKQVRSLDEWWGHVKALPYSTYAERRTYLSKEFDPALTHFEDANPGVVPISPPRAVPPEPRRATTEENAAARGTLIDWMVAATSPSYAPRVTQAPAVAPKPVPKAAPAAALRRVRVFVVHGHDHGPRDAVALLLGKLGFEPVILEDQPNKGRTIIEKFVDYSDVKYAVVLMSPDGRSPVRATIAAEQERNAEVLHIPGRARQNVILELGFFIGKLGRDHVAAVVVGDVEVPSDVDGVLYIKFDPAGAWKNQLAREMKAAGLPVDMNRLA